MKLAKAKEMVGMARKSAAARVAKEAAKSQMRPAICYGAGYALGAMEKSGKQLPNLVGQFAPGVSQFFNEKAQFAAIAALAADRTTGAAKQYLGDAAAALAAIAGFEAGKV